MDNEPTVNDCPNCEYKKNYDYLSSSSFYKELQALRKFKKDNERPQGEWIPVSERLPEGKIDPMTNDFELVLCSTVWGAVRPYKFGKPIGYEKAHFWNGSGEMDDYVIAWMPLPEA